MSMNNLESETLMYLYTAYCTLDTYQQHLGDLHFTNPNSICLLNKLSHFKGSHLFYTVYFWLIDICWLFFVEFYTKRLIIPNMFKCIKLINLVSNTSQHSPLCDGWTPSFHSLHSPTSIVMATSISIKSISTMSHHTLTVCPVEIKSWKLSYDSFSFIQLSFLDCESW